MEELSILRRDRWWPSHGHVADTKVLATTNIPSGVYSLPFVSCLNLKRIFSDQEACTILKASISHQGCLTVEKHVDWIPLLRIAENCDEKNVEADLTTFADSIILKTCKEIRVGDELKVWLSDKLLAFLEIPFLTLYNIKGIDEYKCEECGISYSEPNRLKVHLAFDCKVRQCQNGQNGRSNQLMVESPDSLTPSPSLQNKVYTTKEPKTHVCVYCGKLYTRKYGLKIHLRTHTGHKPLQCRFCGRPFSDPSNLNKHVRLHANNHLLPTKSHQCNECGKVMIRRRDLERHLKARHQHV